MHIDFNLIANKDLNILKDFDPRARILCAFILAVSISLLKLNFNFYSISIQKIFFAALIPIILFIAAPLNKNALINLNIAGFLMLVFMIFSFKDYKLGFYTGLIMLFKLNFICVIFLNMIVLMGVKKIYAALYNFGLNEKLRLLLILTMRGIFILADRTVCAVRAANLRSQNIKNLSFKLRTRLKLKIFACVLASSLIQSIKRSDRMSMAIKCRGGFGGFNQALKLKWRVRDCVLCLFFIFYAIIIFII